MMEQQRIQTKHNIPDDEAQYRVAHNVVKEKIMFVLISIKMGKIIFAEKYNSEKGLTNFMREVGKQEGGHMPIIC